MHCERHERITNNTPHIMKTTKQKIKIAIKKGKVLVDVLNDYSTQKSEQLEKEIWFNYRLTKDGLLIHKKHKELHYKLLNQVKEVIDDYEKDSSLIIHDLKRIVKTYNS